MKIVKYSLALLLIAAASPAFATCKNGATNYPKCDNNTPPPTTPEPPKSSWWNEVKNDLHQDQHQGQDQAQSQTANGGTGVGVGVGYGAGGAGGEGGKGGTGYGGAGGSVAGSGNSANTNLNNATGGSVGNTSATGGNATGGSVGNVSSGSSSGVTVGDTSLANNSNSQSGAYSGGNSLSNGSASQSGATSSSGGNRTDSSANNSGGNSTTSVDAADRSVTNYESQALFIPSVQAAPPSIVAGSTAIVDRGICGPRQGLVTEDVYGTYIGMVRKSKVYLGKSDRLVSIEGQPFLLDVGPDGVKRLIGHRPVSYIAVIGVAGSRSIGLGGGKTGGDWGNAGASGGSSMQRMVVQTNLEDCEFAHTAPAPVVIEVPAKRIRQ
ncbi:hypothetical protein DLP3_117 [Stenotrophomonas phage vB_SmaS_DLP_3]|nr:hypothetical protein DLP3_117 [Stenotrophomonas phage vB_SmaS_DLP_3]